MTCRRVSTLMLILLAFACLTLAHAQTTSGTASQLYRVASPSSYEKGCFGPCACPYDIKDGLVGTFLLTPTAPDPLYANYDITDINWLLPGAGTRITGSGTYKVGEVTPFTQELVLDLSIDGQAPQHFDSGLVTTTTAFPAIDAIVSLDPATCPDIRLRVVGTPVPSSDEVPYVLVWSKYEEGCFGPCLCPVAATLLFGRFDLVKLQDTAEGTDFAVLDVAWFKRSASPTTAAGMSAVMGQGIYRVSTTGKTQRMVLDLMEGGAGPTRFDSGVVPWVDTLLRRVDIEVAANGFACTDRVYSIHAKQRYPSGSVAPTVAIEPVNTDVTPGP